jgi:hypothetical protein
VLAGRMSELVRQRRDLHDDEQDGDEPAQQ